MSMHDQLALAFPVDVSLGDEDFLVADPNRDAYAWIGRWPHWPTAALAVYGPPGCGKSHLAHIFLGRSGGRAVAADELLRRDAAAVLGDAPALVLDHADAVVTGGGERPLLHLINWTGEHGATLLMTAADAPARWPAHLPDLRSRLAAATAVGIRAPDDALIRAVLVKLFADRRVPVSESVLSYLLARMERSFDAARRLAAAMDDAALRAGRPVTLALARTVLAADGAGGPGDASGTPTS